MFCKQCGSQIADDLTFCPNCGYLINLVPKEQTISNENAGQSPATKDPGSAGKVLFLSIISLVFIETPIANLIISIIARAQLRSYRKKGGVKSGTIKVSGVLSMLALLGAIAVNAFYLLLLLFNI